MALLATLDPRFVKLCQATCFVLRSGRVVTGPIILHATERLRDRGRNLARNRDILRAKGLVNVQLVLEALSDIVCF